MQILKCGSGGGILKNNEPNTGNNTNYVSEKKLFGITKLDHEQNTDTLRKKYTFIILTTKQTE
jgi:hypothetical protein